MCPDAYSFAFDDQKSTFIVPSGGGWEIIMCPEGRSTDIIRQLGPQMYEIASGGKLSQKSMELLESMPYLEEKRPEAV